MHNRRTRVHNMVCRKDFPRSFYPDHSPNHFISMARKSPGRKRPDGASPTDSPSREDIQSREDFQYQKGAQPPFIDGTATPLPKSRYCGRPIVNQKQQASSRQQADVVREFIAEHLCDRDLSVLLWWDNLCKITV
jgi:hypothetical protein